MGGHDGSIQILEIIPANYTEENLRSISPHLQLHPIYCTLRSINRNSALNLGQCTREILDVFTNLMAQRNYILEEAHASLLPSYVDLPSSHYICTLRLVTTLTSIIAIILSVCRRYRAG